MISSADLNLKLDPPPGKTRVNGGWTANSAIGRRLGADLLGKLDYTLAFDCNDMFLGFGGRVAA